MMNDPNLANILAAYAVAAIVMVWMAGRIVADHRGLTKALAKVERRKPADRDAG